MAIGVAVSMAATDRADTLTVVRRVAAHDPDQYCRSTAAHDGALH